MFGSTRIQSRVVRVAPYSASAVQYDKLLARPMQPVLARNFLRVTRQRDLSGTTIADVGCGSGRFVHFLAGLGLDVTGVDCSRAMLELARRRNRRGRARFLRQDLRALNLPKPVDMITCQFDTLNYMRHWRDLELAFLRLSANLVRGGYLLFDMIVLPVQALRPVIRRFTVFLPRCETTWLITTSATGIRRAQLDTRCKGPRGTLHITREVHVQQAWPFPMIVRCLRRAGLQLRTVFTVGSPGEPRMFFEVQRKTCRS